MLLEDMICKDCEHLKYSCGEEKWTESIGCYKSLKPIKNQCKEYKQESE